MPFFLYGQMEVIFLMSSENLAYFFSKEIHRWSLVAFPLQQISTLD